jgi:hypothetical protein
MPGIYWGPFIIYSRFLSACGEGDSSNGPTTESHSYSNLKNPVKQITAWCIVLEKASSVDLLQEVARLHWARSSC